MIIATPSTIYALKDRTHSPDKLYTDLSIRRAIKGRATQVIALTDGSVLLGTRTETRRLAANIPNRIDSLCMIHERPLHLLIGTTPPHVYLLQEDSMVTLCASFEALSVRSQ
jgi:hypothetical protein